MNEPSNSSQTHREHESSSAGHASTPGVMRRLLRRRRSLLAAVATLGTGVAIGAAVGPAPQASFAGTELPGLLGTLFGHSAGSGARTASVGPSASEATAPTTEPRRKRRHRRKHAGVGSVGSSSAAPAETTTPSSTSSPKGTSKTALAPVTSVWLIELSGESFSQALAQPAAAPYIDSQLVSAGTLENSWTGLDGSAFANDAALAGLNAPVGSPSPIVEQIVQPPCPEGTPAGAQCAPGTPGALTAADAFAKQAVSVVTANALYRAHGLIVVTFASIAQATAAGLPEGAASSTLTAQPPAGVLLLSPFVHAGVRSSSAFDSTSPTQALTALLGK